MADRVDFYFRQRVTEAELDLACELLEQADQDLAADIGVYGIVTGAVPTQHSPVPDLTGIRHQQDRRQLPPLLTPKPENIPNLIFPVQPASHQPPSPALFN